MTKSNKYFSPSSNKCVTPFSKGSRNGGLFGVIEANKKNLQVQEMYEDDIVKDRFEPEEF